MPILSGDVKLLKSAVMADVPEGGGAPTGAVIADGASNAIFPDISELDRAGGRVNLRKCFVQVATDDTDTYFGANVIVAEPPADPRVSVTLFTTAQTFDTRAEASSRVQAYLNQGPVWGGLLLERHIAGQRSIQLLQMVDTLLPSVGQTLALVLNEGQASEVVQYVRLTEVGYVVRQYPDTSNVLRPMWVVTCSISDALRQDFPGVAAAWNPGAVSGVTRVRDTTVADAATYAGAVSLSAPAALGDMGVQLQAVYTQLVPSAQTEAPLLDLRTNGLANALTATGAPTTRSIYATLSPSQSLFVGSPVLPGSLSLSADGVILRDVAGALLQGNTTVGQIDYDNGILSLSANLWSGPTTFTATLTPATSLATVTETAVIVVSVASRSLNYALVLQAKPLPRALKISYRAAGHWVTLSDAGDGTLRGSSSSAGAGTIVYATGAVSVTLGALPDVGSMVFFQYASDQWSKVAVGGAALQGSAHFALDAGKAITIGGLALSWSHAGVARTAHDNGLGVLTGDASGTVDYASGRIQFSPTLLPAPGTVVLIDTNGAARTSLPQGLTTASTHIGGTNILPGSVSMGLGVTEYVNIDAGPPGYLHTIVNPTTTVGPGVVTLTSSFTGYTTIGVYAVDDGQGHIVGKTQGSESVTLNLGSIDYATGNLTWAADFSPLNGKSLAYGSVAITPTNSSPGAQAYIVPLRNASGFFSTWGLAQGVDGAVTGSYASGVAGPDSLSTTLSTLTLVATPAAGATLQGASFVLGGVQFVQGLDALYRDPAPGTGVGVLAGSVAAAQALVSITNWPVGQSSAVVDWRATLAYPNDGPSAPYCAAQTYLRTAQAPLRPGSLSVVGQMMDGTPFNVSAGLDGKIDALRVKGRVDFETGVVELHFVNPAATGAGSVDLSHLQIAGLSGANPDLASLPSLRYSAVSYSYLPLDAALLGIDPVRLPSDGRVPILRAGGFAVLGHTGALTATPANGQTIDVGRVRLSRVRVVGSDGLVINTGYSANLDAGTLTFTDVAGYSMPLTIEHRIEDMAVVRDVQISGAVSFTRALTHDYPLGSYLSSALVAGDLFARVSLVFDQASWGGAWSDALQGDAATATFNHAQFPIVLTNRGAITERWVVRMTNTNAFEVIGEHVGVIATGNTSTDCAPINPASNAPYFLLPALGWGVGWSAGNVLRINTTGAQFPVWVVRTVQQGPETVHNDHFTLLIRGDVNAA